MGTATMITQSSAIQPVPSLATRRDVESPQHAPYKDFTSFYVPLRTGVSLHYVSPTPRHATLFQSSDQALILVHGYSDSWRSFEEVLPRLALAGLPMPIYAIDVRGHGTSSEAASGSATQAEFAADLAAFLEALQIRQAVLVGHSMGSAIVHKFAVAYPDKTAALVLMGAVPTYAKHPVISSLTEAVAAFQDDAPAPIDFVTEFQSTALFPTVPPAVLYRYVAESLRLPGRVWKAALHGMAQEDHRAQLSTITAPTLIIAGEQDPFFGVAEQHALHKLIAHAMLMIYPHAGHTVHVELPDAVVETVRTFVQNVL